ncbi:STY4528 family pathogenicity island replication protein [Pseudomonas carnis]|uniref:STY4528 family pathogenicity island replication protein n=1 Tax=Pseudomonas carnis TaxID=2487355 RepID=UPI002F968895
MNGGANQRYSAGNLDALNALLNSASASLREARADRPGASREERSSRPLSPISETMEAGIIFTGNPHEAVPRRLLLDNRLTPLERNAWQVFRLLLNDDGLTSFPTYEQLRPYLASSPFKVASRETVAKALTALRMTRWLSLGGCVRDEVTGQMKGNIYLLHDEPVSIAEAALLDSGYLELVNEGLGHANKSIRDVAAHVIQELSTDPYLRENALPSHLERLQQRIEQQSWAKSSTIVRGPSESELCKNDSELSQTVSVRNHVHLRSDSELSRKPEFSGPVRNPNSSTTSTNTKVCKNTVPRAREGIRLPEPFLQLAAEQRRNAMVALGTMDFELQQQVLDQWSARCANTEIRNPGGYLFGMIQKAQRGEFNQPVERGSGMPSGDSCGRPRTSKQGTIQSLELTVRREKPSAESLMTGREGVKAILDLLKLGVNP